MQHPKERVHVRHGPVAGSFIREGSAQMLYGDTVSSGDMVHKLFEIGIFRYQFLHSKHDPDRRSRICRCSSFDEAQWLSQQVTEHGPIVVAMM